MLKIIFLICLFVLVENLNTILSAQHISYTFSEVVRLGEGTEIDDVFIFPYSLMSDREGNIYVAERRLNVIRKYGPNGKHLTNIGGRGRGPGEFVELSVMFIDNFEEELVVIDRMSMRLNTFDLEGRYKTSYDLFGENNTILSPWLGRADKEGNYFLLYRLPVFPDQPRPKDDHLIHVYNRQGQKHASFAEVFLFGDPDNYFMQQFIGGPTTGFFEVLPNGRVLVAPFIFNGEIYVFEQRGEHWEISKTFSAPCTGESFRQIDARNAPDYARTIGTPRGRISGLINCESIGAHMIGNKYLVFYTFRRDENYHGELGASLFDFNSGEFLGYTRIDELNEIQPQPRRTSPIRALWYKKDNLYFIDYRQDEPHIVVALIDFDIDFQN